MTNATTSKGDQVSGTNAELIATARRIADLCPRSDASATFMGLITALGAAEAERDAALAVIAAAKAAAYVPWPWPYSTETANRVGKLVDVLSSAKVAK